MFNKIKDQIDEHIETKEKLVKQAGKDDKKKEEFKSQIKELSKKIKKTKKEKSSRSKIPTLKKERDEVFASLQKLRKKTSLKPTHDAIRDLLKDFNLKEEKPKTVSKEKA